MLDSLAALVKQAKASARSPVPRSNSSPSTSNSSDSDMSCSEVTPDKLVKIVEILESVVNKKGRSLETITKRFSR